MNTTHDVSMEAVRSTTRVGALIALAVATIALALSVAIGLPAEQGIGLTLLALAAGVLTGGFGFAVSWGRSRRSY